ncbi:MAG TPA: hypothetical protein VJN96_04275 [Vicinamibacterales bacterium]|nr:hypothetical protein [Vicinamibacterales bacterium]
MNARFAAADVVVSGRVGRVRAAAPRAPRRNLPGPITEHDPQWQEAVVEVTAVRKGRRVPRSVRVRFPASTDVAWARAPKLHAGQQGTFLLKREGAGYTVIDVDPTP